MKISYEDGHVVVRIPCTDKEIKNAPMSSSGKNKMVATTSGFTPVEGAPGQVRVSLNLIAK